ncbi:2-succinyl-5-enolpyruvyl-6-hydroxy-3-cyclohexene-1-carboxylate synthase [Austwickia chelonae]|uniref:2-succinyl-5-enolpyruvyl-6-hydroxy-3-cyclohexene-1-carboxylate synthase n=1 Tax=Austwickia chelonae NBRC 105200 TaxID=1184607 RepID=K6V763_9MICO|nr:2-succinyl-5-enolpyruvyl-6-hydroxy-3-cyclohexene-1-carboxylic-acid synthase [Austwickia chelonae]GAB78043.1 2-succinyl-5-enolpyruvyl-6-hydroxy-3-cyclohexene-1-carboxylate synthase [Austwickia chelonae NBRC 105200]SEV95020.1 2-succinyl-5-enolpyruvyl-6-hydroxy-3-cyclohexene-1-carboxylate synthase [Austwickia chelonae]
MNPSMACAVVMVDELIRLGLRHAVLCPGSRSAPLAYALADADAAGRLTLHVRVDERSAAFLAVGLAKENRVPAVVVTTSGTAVANLHPAVLEADSSGVPLLVLSADRPPELRGTGANQTMDQVKLFGAAVRWAHDLGVPEMRAGQQSVWRSCLDRAWSAAVGDLGGRPGPVHVNVPLRDPLLPDLSERSEQWPEDLDGRPEGRPWTATGPETKSAFTSSSVVEPLPDVPRTLVLLGDMNDPEACLDVVDGAQSMGWPVVAEPFGRRHLRGVVPHGPLAVTVPGFLDSHLPERILVFGRLTLTRSLAGLLRTPGVPVESVAASQAWPDPGHVLSRVHPWASWQARRQSGYGVARSDEDCSWTAAWAEAGRRLGARVGTLLESEELWPSGPALAKAVLSALPAGSRLFVGSSNAARDVDLARSADEVVVFASRGLAGIDGNVSTACGLALAGGSPTYALMGDLTFLHDANALLLGPDEPEPDITFVVADDSGGGIFATLEYGEAGRERFFDRVFATPVRTDLAVVAAASGISTVEAHDRAALMAELSAPPRGVRVVRVSLDRSVHREVGRRLQGAAAEVLSAC